MLKNRRSRLSRIFEENKIGLLLVEHPVNLRYFAGFSGSEGALLITPDSGGWFGVDSRYTLQASREADGLEVVEYSQRLEWIADMVGKSGVERVGFEAAHTTFSNHQKLSEKLSGAELVPVGAGLDSVRDCKDATELELLSRVARIASESLEAVLHMIKPGMVESRLALELEFEMRRRGAEGRSFDFIVASGERGAMPHGRASDKVIQAGELVTIDFGAVCNGYCSDETVTLAIGSVNDTQRKIYDTVLEAHDRAVAAVRPGIACRDIDAVARDFIAGHGYGNYFGHGLGHGIGLDVHEKPVISPRSDAVVCEGMVFTIEPGIYIPGVGGVRIEDTVAVTDNGCRLLTSVSKQLQIL